MTPDQHTLAIKYLMGRLPPEDQDELKTLIGEEDMPDIAEDAAAGKIAMDRVPARLKRQMAARASAESRGDAEARFDERYPGASKVRTA